MLFNWQKYIGSSTCFLNLPRDLRDKIYTHALGGEIYPKRSDYDPAAPQNARLILGNGYSRHSSPWSSVPELRNFTFEPNLALLPTNSQINDEMKYAGWVLMRARFYDVYTFYGAVNAQTSPAIPYNPFSKFELNFTNFHYFRFFCVELRPHYPHRVIESGSGGHTLQGIENLKDLHLHFRPLDDGWEGSPWGARNPAPYECCQRTVVDWILTFAYPFLIDKWKTEKLTVTLTGAIKTDTKAKWEAIFRGERDHDQAAAMKAILDTPDTDL
jgi:hypothetical protein